MAQTGFCKEKPSGDAGSAWQTGHRGLSRGGGRNELPVPPQWGPFRVHLTPR